MKKQLLSTIILSVGFILVTQAQVLPKKDSTVSSSISHSPVQKHWYEKISMRGYVQVRYNGLIETNSKLKNDQGDKSWGGNGGFFIRRARLIFSGDVHERVYIYIQPDLASSVSTAIAGQYAQIRDAYFDLALTKDKSYRLRFGQSKVPYGFENLQSSQNRIPLDRNDGINSAVVNERDLGVFFYWAPKHVRERFAYLVSSGLKGSGDYGVFGVGAYNGSTANIPEQNKNRHIVGRLTYPFQLKNGQFIETSVQAYSGNYLVTRSTGVKSSVGGSEFNEWRAAGTVVYYPQPFGFVAEWNVGEGPEYNPANNTVERKALKGGYVQAMYYIKAGEQLIIPFFRNHYYHGGKKFEADATRYRVNEQEVGIEWQPIKNFELVTMYTFSERRFESSAKKNNFQKGSLLRLQAQFNF